MKWRRFPRVGTRVGRVLFLWDTFYLIGNLFHSTRDTFYFSMKFVEIIQVMMISKQKSVNFWAIACKTVKSIKQKGENELFLFGG